ncbi:MAG TPA: putative porin [Nitrospiria bacterium]|jgi:hypothetical protein
MKRKISMLMTLLALGIVHIPVLGATDLKFSDFVDEIKLKGDLRLRHESFWKNPDQDRHRQRLRLRVETKFKISDFTAGIRIASGSADQTSTNQTFDNLFSSKDIFLDRAYLSWKGANTEWLKLTGGKMAIPFFTFYSTDIVWDSDVNPEGFSESFSFPIGSEIFVNLGQFVLDEDSGSNKDQWMFGQQVGLTLDLVENTEATLAIAYYVTDNATQSTLSQASTLDGNSRDGSGVLINEYRTLDVTGVVKTKIGGLPVSVGGDYIKNLTDTVNAAGTGTGNDGYQVGVILGKAKKAKDWEVAYFFKRVETDATLADISDSDFGDGGLNRKGHIVWGAYRIFDFLKTQVKFFSTEALSEPKDDIDRLQVDLIGYF